MTGSVEAELKTLLTYFGENAEPPDAPKPEDFFGMILSFSSSLQVRTYILDHRHALTSAQQQKAALEVHDAEEKTAPKTPKISVDASTATTADEEVRHHAHLHFSQRLTSHLQTIKNVDKSGNTLRPPPSSQGRAGGLSVGRGDLDQAIRSMRTGKRRARPQRPVSRIFLDGGRNSRIYE